MESWLDSVNAGELLALDVDWINIKEHLLKAPGLKQVLSLSRGKAEQHIPAVCLSLVSPCFSFGTWGLGRVNYCRLFQLLHHIYFCISSPPHLGGGVSCHPCEPRSGNKWLRNAVSSRLQSLHLALQRQCWVDKTRLNIWTFDLWFLQLVQSNFVLFCTYAADLRDHFQNIVLTILVSGDSPINTQRYTMIWTTVTPIRPWLKLERLFNIIFYIIHVILLRETSHFAHLHPPLPIHKHHDNAFLTYWITIKTIFFLCVTHYPFALVYPGVCSDKRPVVAMVSGEVWEKDGSFLRHHCEYTVFLLVCFNADYYTACATLWTKMGMWSPYP